MSISPGADDPAGGPARLLGPGREGLRRLVQGSGQRSCRLRRSPQREPVHWVEEPRGDVERGLAGLGGLSGPKTGQARGFGGEAGGGPLNRVEPGVHGGVGVGCGLFREVSGPETAWLLFKIPLFESTTQQNASCHIPGWPSLAHYTGSGGRGGGSTRNTRWAQIHRNNCLGDGETLLSCRCTATRVARAAVAQTAGAGSPA